MSSYEVRVQARFEAAHHLTSYMGSPEPVHGHSWLVEAEVTAARLDDEGMAFDFIRLQEHLRKLTAKLHHRDLNTVAPFDQTTPTSENLAAWFFGELAPAIDGARARLSAVTVWEGPECRVTYRESDG